MQSCMAWTDHIKVNLHICSSELLSSYVWCAKKTELHLPLQISVVNGKGGAVVVEGVGGGGAGGGGVVVGCNTISSHFIQS